MKKEFLKRFQVVLSLIVALCPISVWGLNPEPADSLHFKLSADTAFIQHTTTESETEIAEVIFSIKFDSSWSGTLTNILVGITYDTTKHVFLDAEKNSSNWTGDFGYDNTTPGELILSFDSGSVTTFDTAGFTDFATIEFNILCQEELTTGGVEFVRNGFSSNITVSTADYFPASENWYDGTVTSAYYFATFTIHDSTFSNSCQTQVTIPVYGSTNYSTYAAFHWIVYDQDKLQFDGFVLELPWSFMTPDTSRTDTLVAQLISLSGTPEFEDEPAYEILFTILDDLSGESTTIYFFEDSSWNLPKACTEINIDATYPDTAELSLEDSAVFRAIYSGGSLTKEDDGTLLTYYLALKSSFLSGIAYDQVDDTGLVYNILFGQNLDLSGGIDSTYESVKFTCTETGDSLASIYQIYDSSKTNIIDVNSDFDTLMRIEVEFDTAGFVPDWDDRYLHPKFIHNFGGGGGKSSVPDTNGCLDADSTNGQLRFWGADTFDSVEVEMGQFYTVGHSSTTPCTWSEVYVRSTFDLDSFYVRVSVPSFQKIVSISEKITGVASTKINNYTYDIYSTSLFSTLPAADSLVKICKIHLGLNTPCLSNKSYAISVTFSNMKMWDDSDIFHYVDKGGGSSQAKCSSSGTGCGGGGGDPDPPMEKPSDDGNIPTVFALHQNYPNPFNPITTISFDLPKQSYYELTVYNIIGQIVETFTGHREAGTVEIQWYASSQPSGVYLYKLMAGDFTDKKKMLLLK